MIESAAKEQRDKIKELMPKKKTLQNKLTQIDKKAKNLMEILKGGGYILKEIESLDEQTKQLKKEIDFIDFEINNQESKIVNADVIRENFKVFRDVYEQLTQEEKYDLLHLLIKKITYCEDTKTTDDGKKTGKIKMDLWELSSIDPSMINSTKHNNSGFAKRNGCPLKTLHKTF